MQTRIVWLLLLTWGLSAKTLPAQVGAASWYGERYHGQKRGSGETFDMHRLTAAHRTLPFGSLVRVTDTRTGRSVTVRINDRGPFVEDRLLDLSYAAARELGMVQSGVAQVWIESVMGSGGEEAAGSASGVVVERFRPRLPQTPGASARNWYSGFSDQTLERSALGRQRLQAEEEPAVGARNGRNRARNGKWFDGAGFSGSELRCRSRISGACAPGCWGIDGDGVMRLLNARMTAEWQAAVSEEAVRIPPWRRNPARATLL